MKTFITLIAGVAAAGAVLGIAYFAVVLAWQDQRTRELEYYGLSSDRRARFRRTLLLHARLLRPIIAGLARIARPGMEKASFRELGHAGPMGSCSPESFRAAAEYVPQAHDIFVVTQMRSGTTWMQHLVYQVLCRGEGDLAEQGLSLAAVSPWLEGTRTVPVHVAPLVGKERPSRIVKSHLPSDVCPHGHDARYVYVARNPASCFASCADFLAANLGPFCPDLDQIRDWYCSDQAMWWGSWPRHVSGWCDVAQANENVLFVRFEEMTDDLPEVIRRLIDFLGMRPFDEDEMNSVVAKCSFTYMRRHAHSFEMSPPNLFAVDATLLPKGTSDRDRELPVELRDDVMNWCRGRVESSTCPAIAHYLAS